NGGILPYALANNGSTAGSDFASYDFTNNSIAPFNGYVNSVLSSTSTGDIIKLGANEVLTGDKTVTAILINGGTTLSEANFLLTVVGRTGLGAILSLNGNNAIVGNKLNVGTEGVIFSGGPGGTGNVSTL